MAKAYLDNVECMQPLVVPVYLLEEAAIIPQIKARYYSISHDPFPDGVEFTKELKFIFSEALIKSEMHPKGLAT